MNSSTDYQSEYQARASLTENRKISSILKQRPNTRSVIEGYRKTMGPRHTRNISFFENSNFQMSTNPFLKGPLSQEIVNQPLITQRPDLSTTASAYSKHRGSQASKRLFMLSEKRKSVPPSIRLPDSKENVITHAPIVNQQTPIKSRF